APSSSPRRRTPRSTSGSRMSRRSTRTRSSTPPGSSRRTRPPRPASRRPPGSVGRVGADGPLGELRELTRRLRAECPWDREQTARTIVPHTVGEASEVAAAAFADDPAKLLDELGDLLFQVFFLSLLLEEQGAGDLDDVTRAVHEKLVTRHTQVVLDSADGSGQRRG